MDGFPLSSLGRTLKTQIISKDFGYVPPKVGQVCAAVEARPFAPRFAAISPVPQIHLHRLARHFRFMQHKAHNSARSIVWARKEAPAQPFDRRRTEHNGCR